MIASLLLLVASLAMATAQLATSNFDFQPYANATYLGGIQQAVVQLPSSLTYTLNGASQTAPAGSFIMYGGGYENTAIVPLTTSAAAGSVQPTIIGPPLANYSAIGCGSRSGATVLYIVGTAASAQKNMTNDIFYVYRSYDGVTWPNVLDAATTQAWMSRQNEDNTMCVVLTNGNVVSIGSSDTWSSANQGVTWTQTAQTGNRWSARTFFAGGIYTTSSGVDTIVIVGGRDAPSAASPYGGQDHNDVWQSQDAGASWTQLTASAGFTPRDQLSWAVSQTGLMVVFAGDQYGGYGSFYSDMWYSTNGGSNWSMLKSVTSIGNASQCELLFDSQGYLYLFGLQTNNYLWTPTSARTNVPISTTASNNNGAGQMASVPVVFLLVNVIAVLSYVFLL